jgi:hypothetical protein
VFLANITSCGQRSKITAHPTATAKRNRQQNHFPVANANRLLSSIRNRSKSLLLGYTPKMTKTSVRGDLTEAPGRLQFKVPGMNQVLAIMIHPKNTGAQSEIRRKLGQTVVL